MTVFDNTACGTQIVRELNNALVDHLIDQFSAYVATDKIPANRYIGRGSSEDWSLPPTIEDRQLTPTLSEGDNVLLDY